MIYTYKIELKIEEYLFIIYKQIFFYFNLLLFNYIFLSTAKAKLKYFKESVVEPS